MLDAPKSKVVQKTREVRTLQIEPAQGGGIGLKGGVASCDTMVGTAQLTEQLAPLLRHRIIITFQMLP
jgi:hypothetical protein